MKKTFRKLALAFAAASTVALAAGASAMAADITASYDADNNSIPVTVPSNAASGTQATVLVVPTDKKDHVQDSDVLYIAQKEAAALSATALLKGESIANGEYSVLVGYYNNDGIFSIKEDNFTIGSTSATREILIGDVTMDGEADNMDAQQILMHSVNLETEFAKNPDAMIAGDVNDDEEVDNVDAQQVLMYSVELPVSTNVGKTAVVNEENKIVEWR